MTYEERQAEISRLKKENESLLNHPLMSEGGISPMQVGMFSPRAKKAWQEKGMEKLTLKARINWLSQSDEELKRIDDAIAQDKKNKRIAQIQSRLDLIHGLGRMSHKDNGKLRRPYAIEVVKLEEELAEIA